MSLSHLIQIAAVKSKYKAMERKVIIDAANRPILLDQEDLEVEEEELVVCNTDKKHQDCGMACPVWREIRAIRYSCAQMSINKLNIRSRLGSACVSLTSASAVAKILQS